MQTNMVCDIKFTEPPSFRSDAALLLNLNLNYEKLRLILLQYSCQNHIFWSLAYFKSKVFSPPASNFTTAFASPPVPVTETTVPVPKRSCLTRSPPATLISPIITDDDKCPPEGVCEEQDSNGVSLRNRDISGAVRTGVRGTYSSS